jgi:hypothetical protein
LIKEKAMSRKVVFVVLGLVIVFVAVLAVYTQPGLAFAVPNGDECKTIKVCKNGETIKVNTCPRKIGNDVAWKPGNDYLAVGGNGNSGFNGVNGFLPGCGPGDVCTLGACPEREITVPVPPTTRATRWVRYESLYSRPGTAGYGFLTFKANKVDPYQATLIIDGVGTFEVMGLSCTGGVLKTCTGYITGLPIGGTPESHGGLLKVNNSAHVATASLIFVPPPPAP